MSYTVGEVVYCTRVPNRMGVVTKTGVDSPCGRFKGGYEVKWLNGSRKGKSEFRRSWAICAQKAREDEARATLAAEVARTKHWATEAKLQW